MNFESKGNTLTIYVRRYFNYNVVGQIKKIYKQEKKVIISLNNVKFLDSEAIIFLQKLMFDGAKITLINAPDLLFECLRILNLKQFWSQHVTYKSSPKS